MENVSDEQFKALFHMMAASELAKEAIPDVIGWLAKNEGASVDEAVTRLGLGALGAEELEKIVDEAVRGNQKLIAERGSGAFGALMGIVMGKVRGKAKAEAVSELLKKKLAKSS